MKKITNWKELTTTNKFVAMWGMASMFVFITTILKIVGTILTVNFSSWLNTYVDNHPNLSYNQNNMMIYGSAAIGIIIPIFFILLGWAFILRARKHSYSSKPPYFLTIAILGTIMLFLSVLVIIFWNSDEKFIKDLSDGIEKNEIKDKLATYHTKILNWITLAFSIGSVASIWVTWAFAKNFKNEQKAFSPID